MNILLKSAIAGALALGASGAFAAGVGIPSTGSSDLILLVVDENSGATYGLDTTTGIGTLMAGTLSGGQVLSTSLAGVNSSNSASTALQSFISTNEGKGDTLGWTVEGAQFSAGNTTSNSTNGNSKAVGAAEFVFSSSNGTTTPSNVSQFVLANLESFVNQYSNDLKTGNLSSLLTASETTTALSTPASESKYSLLGGPDLTALGGGAVNLFGFTGEGDTGALSSYVLGTASVDANGNLTITGNSGGGGGGGTAPVPVPAAVWLFGSGLMGLVGVSRRRKIAVKTAA